MEKIGNTRWLRRGTWRLRFCVGSCPPASEVKIHPHRPLIVCIRGRKGPFPGCFRCESLEILARAAHDSAGVDDRPLLVERDANRHDDCAADGVRALDGISGITSLMGEGGPAGIICTSRSTGVTAGATAMGGSSETAGAGVGSLQNMLTPSHISTAKTDARVSHLALLLWRGRVGAGGAPSGGSLIRITSRWVGGVSDTCALSSISSACAIDESIIKSARRREIAAARMHFRGTFRLKPLLAGR